MFNFDLVIYHSRCIDGFGSAYVVWRYCRENDLPMPEFVAAGHGSCRPVGLEGKNVLICDYSYPLAVTREIIAEAASVFIIDHHESARVDLESVSAEHKLFGKRSGAVLTWQYFYPDVDVPQLLLYIEDRDICARKMPRYGEFFSWFKTVPFDFDVYHSIAGSDDILGGLERGKTYLELDQYNTRDIASHIVCRFIRLKDKAGELYLLAGHICSNVLGSDIGNYGFQLYPFLDVMVVHKTSDYENRTTFSLRSTDQHMDVSAIAKRFLHGGGHRNASGGTIAALTNCISPATLDIFTTYNLMVNDLVFETCEGYLSVEVNSTHNKSALAKYLMQPKFMLDGREINVATAAMVLATYKDAIDWNAEEFRTKYITALKAADDVVMAFVWKYNGKTNDITYIHAFGSTVTPEEITEFTYDLTPELAEKAARDRIYKSTCEFSEFITRTD